MALLTASTPEVFLELKDLTSGHAAQAVIPSTHTVTLCPDPTVRPLQTVYTFGAAEYSNHVIVYELQVVDNSDGYLSLLDSDGSVVEHIKSPLGDVGAQLTDLFESHQDVFVVLWQTQHDEYVVSVRAA